MFRNRIIKILALLMVFNILIIPLTSFTPQQQNKYKVYAAEGIVDIKFFNAVISMIGITAAGLATMSPSFSIPEADMVEMKNNFAQTLEADAVKKQAWLAAQTDYLAGGIAKTMGAVELAKIGVNDIYVSLKDYINNNINSIEIPITDTTYTSTAGNYTLNQTMGNIMYYNFFTSPSSIWEYRSPISSGYPHEFSYYKSGGYGTVYGIYSFVIKNINNINVGNINLFIEYSNIKIQVHTTSTDPKVKYLLYNHLLRYGIDITQYDPNWLNNSIKGTVTNTNIINKTDTSISIQPTIPWIDASIPIGTVVTPSISSPYAGAVPIDIPLSIPIDPTDPIDPPVEDNIAGTVAAILAGLFPILGVLNKIEVGQATISDVITIGLTGVIDGIGDIAGTLTGGIISTLTDIKTSITYFVNPSPETVSQLDLNPIKNIPGVLFTRFPFSIPFDFYNIIAFMGGSAREAPVFEFKIDLSSLLLPDIEKQIDMQPFNQIAGYVRIAELLAFAIAVMLKTKTLIWG